MDPPIDFAELAGDLKWDGGSVKKLLREQRELRDYTDSVVARIAQCSMKGLYGAGGIRRDIFSQTLESTGPLKREVYLDDSGLKHVRIPIMIPVKPTPIIYVVADDAGRVVDRYKVGRHERSYDELCRRYNTYASDVHLYFAALGSKEIERQIHVSLTEFRLPRGDMQGRSEVVMLPLPELIRRLKGFVNLEDIKHVSETGPEENRNLLTGEPAREMVRAWVIERKILKFLQECMKEKTGLVRVYQMFDAWVRSRRAFVGLTEFVKQMLMEGCELTRYPTDTRKYFRVNN